MRTDAEKKQIIFPYPYYWILPICSILIGVWLWKSYREIILFFTFAGAGLVIFFVYFARICIIGKEGIRVTYLGIPYRFVAWKEVQDYVLAQGVESRLHPQYHLLCLLGAPQYPHCPVDDIHYLRPERYVRRNRKYCVYVLSTRKSDKAIAAYFREPDYVVKKKYG